MNLPPIFASNIAKPNEWRGLANEKHFRTI
jgi:hypothetical protein